MARQVAQRASASPPDTDSRHAANHRIADAATRAKVAKLELTVTRKIDGVLLGEYQGLIPGPGSEPGEARQYEVGDDVRAMDWAVTARTTEPHVRQTIADRELETWLLVDLSPTIDTGGSAAHDPKATTSKRDLALAACATFGFLSAQAGNRVGLVIVGAGEPRIVPPAGGRDHVRAIVELVGTTAVDVTKRYDGEQSTPEQNDKPTHKNCWRRLTQSWHHDTPAAEQRPTGIEHGLRLLRGLAKRRGLIVVISDFLNTVDWERSLRVLAPRQELLAVRLTDPLDVALPVVGAVMLQDTMTGELVEVNVTEQQAHDFAAAARAQRQQVATVMRRCGAPVLTMRTDRDWVRDIIEFTTMRRRGAFPDGERALADIGGAR